MLHHNSQKRIYSEDFIYFITTKTFNDFPYFKEEIFCQLFIEELRIIKELKQFELYAFVILPDHIHLLLQPNGKYNVSKIMHSLKKSFSRDINNIIECNIQFNEGAIHESRLQMNESRLQGEQYSFHRRKVYKVPNFNQYIEQINLPNNYPLFHWQKSYFDHYIRNEHDFQNHIAYIATNPVRHGLAKDETKYCWSFLNPEFKDLIDS